MCSMTCGVCLQSGMLNSLLGPTSQPVGIFRKRSPSGAWIFPPPSPAGSDRRAAAGRLAGGLSAAVRALHAASAAPQNRAG